jgi:hypothetical protein
MKHYYRATVKDGKFKLRNSKVFNESIKYYQDGNYLVALYKMTDKTTREWQQLYFAVLGEWSNDTGLTKDELHDMIKAELFDELFEKTSTTDLTNREWNILFINLENFLILKFENK